MLVSWTQQESAVRDGFLVSETEAYLPSELNAQEQISLSSLAPTPGEHLRSTLRYLLVLWWFFPPSPMCSGSRSQQEPRSAPWGTSGTLILDFAVPSGSSVPWAGTPMFSSSLAKSDYIYSSDCAQAKGVSYTTWL